MKELSLGVYVPSYKRADNILTANILERCTYVVRKTEEEAYRKAGIEDIWAVDDELINSAMKVYDFIIQNAPEDVIFVADDDIDDVTYRLDDNTKIGRDKEVIMSEIERIAQLLVDLKLGYACIDATGVPYGYDGEFSFKGTSGSMKWVYKEMFKSKLDYKVPYNWDLDIVLQELLHNRIILKPRYIVDNGRGDVAKGGDSEKKWQERKDSISNMKYKWGSYFKYNFDNNKPNINVKR